MVFKVHANESNSTVDQLADYGSRVSRLNHDKQSCNNSELNWKRNWVNELSVTKLIKSI